MRSADIQTLMNEIPVNIGTIASNFAKASPRRAKRNKRLVLMSLQPNISAHIYLPRLRQFQIPKTGRKKRVFMWKDCLKTEAHLQMFSKNHLEKKKQQSFFEKFYLELVRYETNNYFTKITYTSGSFCRWYFLYKRLYAILYAVKIYGLTD